jgi:hypothetical protein
MPINYKEYPDNWKWLSRQIIKDAGNKCELCYAPNGVLIKRNGKDKNYPWQYTTEQDIIDNEKTTKIVLTVHHIDSNKMNSKKQNLIALCQRCHLRLDLQKHMKNRAAKKYDLQT